MIIHNMRPLRETIRTREGVAPHPGLSAPMLGLIQRLSLAREGQAAGIIAFIAARRREGTSTIASHYARTLSVSADRSVLLIEAGPPVAREPRNDGDGFVPGIVDSVSGGHDMMDALRPMGERILRGRWFNAEDMRGKASQVAHDESFWERLAKRFDSIVIDAPSLQFSYDGVLLAAKADAAVIVIEAEKTPAVVIENLQETLLAAGARIAGAVMNKRRYYIPPHIYKRI